MASAYIVPAEDLGRVKRIARGLAAGMCLTPEQMKKIGEELLLLVSMAEQMPIQREEDSSPEG